MKKHEVKENLVYVALWGILFLTPVLAAYLRVAADLKSTATPPSVGQGGFISWAEVFPVWRIYAVFLVFFLVHNFLLAPLLVYKHKKKLYFSSVVLLMAVFFLYQCANRPDMKKDRGERIEGLGNLQFDNLQFTISHLTNNQHPTPPPMDGMMPPPKPGGSPPAPRRGDVAPNDPTPLLPPLGRDGVGSTQHPTPMDGMHRPPLFFGQHDIVMLVVLILMLGMNLGVKLYFKSSSDAKKLDELQTKNLEQQLEYLKYQINPHFFMNTLNNIHALVDINPEKAKETILELSKLMRYVLYEGAKPAVPLQKEVDFLNNYITLMRIRYTDRVKITTDMPATLPDKNVPPMLFITFVENAFKHGVSYSKDSFINVSMSVVDKRVEFICENSKTEAANDEQGGVGLTNVKQRLNLIYDNEYTLNINDAPDVYDVHLSIPLVKIDNNQ
ncbi:MAG: histidine kinase [Prevotella sp.]|nr:histidine kinase [Prevotella sp.]